MMLEQIKFLANIKTESDIDYKIRRQERRINEDEMILVFGKEAVKDFCKCNAWKYRYREGMKGSKEEDLKKAKNYLEWEIGEKNG